jgi:hypothetical protein
MNLDKNVDELNKLIRSNNGNKGSNEYNKRMLDIFYRVQKKIFLPLGDLESDPIKVSFSELTSILYLYFLDALQNKDLNIDSYNFHINLPRKESSGHQILEEMNSLKTDPIILAYLKWLIDPDFGFVSKLIDIVKEIRSGKVLKLESLNVPIREIPVANLLNAVLLYGRNSKNSNKTITSKQKVAKKIYVNFRRKQNYLKELLAKFSVSQLDVMINKLYSKWEDILYKNYYFQYMIYLAKFYDLPYQNMNQFFKIGNGNGNGKYFTIREMGDHIILTGFSPIDVSDEFVISDTVKSGKMMTVYNVSQRVDVTIKNLMQKLSRGDSSNLIESHDNNSVQSTIIFDNSQRVFKIQVQNWNENRGQNRSNRKMPSIYKPKSSIWGGGNTGNTGNNDIRGISIKISDEIIAGEKKTVMEVFLNEVFLYVFFKQGSFLSY